MAAIVATACLILGLVVIFIVALIAVRRFLGQAKTKGVNVFDGIDPDELAVISRMLGELRRDELQQRVREKLTKAGATAPAPAPAPVAQPAQKPAA